VTSPEVTCLDLIIANPIARTQASNTLSPLTALKDQQDIKTQNPIKKGQLNSLFKDIAKDVVAGLEDNSKVPYLPLLKLFKFFFYNFGLFA